MQQKVQFIAAMLHEPELVILDEPFSGLDPINAQAMKDTVVDLKREGRTVIFSTHLMDSAERLCDAVCIIARGEKVLDGPIEEVRAEHGGTHVALSLGGSSANGVGAVLNDPRLVARLNDSNRFFEIELDDRRGPAAVAAAADGGRRVDSALRAGEAVAAPDLPAEGGRERHRVRDDGVDVRPVSPSASRLHVGCW